MVVVLRHTGSCPGIGRWGRGRPGVPPKLQNKVGCGGRDLDAGVVCSTARPGESVHACWAWGTDGFVRSNRLEKDLGPSLGLPGMLRMENAPVRCWKASQPHCYSRMSPLGFNVSDSALPLPPIPCWGALHEGKEPVMINFTDTLAFLPN